MFAIRGPSAHNRLIAGLGYVGACGRETDVLPLTPRSNGMDLNEKYADHQKAVIQAALASNETARDAHLDNAATIATQIQRYQLRLGAAASCAWSASQLDDAAYFGANGPASGRNTQRS